MSISPYLKPRTFFRRISAAIQPKRSQLPKANTADLQPQSVWYKNDWQKFNQNFTNFADNHVFVVAHASFEAVMAKTRALPLFLR